MINFKAYPFFKILVFFVLGIISYINFETYIRLPIGICISGIILGGIYLRFWKITYLKNDKLHLTILLIVSWLFGYLITQTKDDSKLKNHISKFKNITAFEATVIDEVEIKPKYLKTRLSVNKVKLVNEWHISNGEILAYLPKNREGVKYGAKLLFNNHFAEINKPLNPEEFNLKKFYNFHQIYFQIFSKGGDFIVLGYEKEYFSIKKVALLIREKVAGIFAKYLKEERERNIASALILGIKSSLDAEITNAYSATGTMHVLAVSGLHVGFFYQILLLLTGFLSKIKNGNIVRSCLLIIILWFYAFITGFCPSVLRAVTMLSIIIIGKLLKREISPFNALFATAFILLTVNPYMIMEVGFQLSFLAVYGILVLVNFFAEKIFIENRLVKYFWEILLMSVSAQLMTFPLSSLYFHQFPNYFLLSNFIVIPFAILIMYSGLIFLSVSFWDLAATITGNIVEKMVWILNKLILFIEDLPYSNYKKIYFSIFETWIIYILIFSFIAFIFFKKKEYIYYFFILSLIFSISSMTRLFENNNKIEIVVYQINKSFVINFIKNRNYELLQSENLIGDESKFRFHISNHIAKLNLEAKTKIVAKRETNFGCIYVFESHKILHFSKKTYQPINKEMIENSIILISNNCISTEEISHYMLHSPKVIIIDGSCSKYYVDRIKDLQSPKIHITSKDGAYEFIFESIIKKII